uniref:Uncharacterized protein n=1 Tax=Romanomermis culicivorax TaxID=13658 RepID=A0A915JC64_ROMCU
PRRGVANRNADAVSRFPHRASEPAFDIDTLETRPETNSINTGSINVNVVAPIQGLEDEATEMEELAKNFSQYQHMDKDTCLLCSKLHSGDQEIKKHYCEENGLLYHIINRKNRLYIPKALQNEIDRHCLALKKRKAKAAPNAVTPTTAAQPNRL